MPTTFRAYQPSTNPCFCRRTCRSGFPQGTWLIRQRCGRCTAAHGLTAFYAPYEWGRSTQRPLRAVDDGQGADLCLRDGHILLARGGEEAGGGCSAFGCSRRATSRNIARYVSSDADMLAAFSELFVGVVQWPRDGTGAVRQALGRRDEGASEREQARGDELERMGKEAARLQAEIEALLTKAGMVDAEEDEPLGRGFPGRRQLPEELQRREQRLAAIQAAKARLEAAQRGQTMSAGASLGRTAIPGAGGPDKRAYGGPSRRRSNFTDPESQIMKTSSEGFPSASATTRRWRWRWGAPDHRRGSGGATGPTRVSWWGCSTRSTRRLGSDRLRCSTGRCGLLAEPDLSELEDRGIDRT